MDVIPFARAAGVQPFVAFLNRVGAPTESLWERSGLPAEALHDPESLTPLPLQFRFAEDAARAEGIPSLGFLAGQQSGVRSLGTFGDTVRTAVTLHQAIQLARTNQPLFNSGIRFELVPQGESVRFTCRLRRHDSSFSQAPQLILAFLLEIVRSAAGADWRPREVDLQGRGDSLRELEPFSGIEIRSACRATGFSFPRFLLARRLDWSVPSRDGGHGEPPAAWLSSAPATDVAGSVQELVGFLLRAGSADVASAAGASGMSLRTFHRKLSEIGISFARLVEDARFAMARRLLDEPRVKVIEIAYELGYSDHAHFTRAFKRWSSLSPAEYRRLRITEGGDRSRVTL